MGMHVAAQLCEMIDAVGSADDLRLAMRDSCAALDFQYFALSHHVDVAAAPTPTIRIHNYPGHWAAYYDDRCLGVVDPVHRASHVTSVGFRWSHMPAMIALTAADRRILALGREAGIGDGFTVPANVPGEARGSCSFANEAGRPLPVAMLPLAQLAGGFAFEAARRLTLPRGLTRDDRPVLTDRQRDCVLWAARGKGDWEIGRILGVSEETVARHIKQACDRYGVNKRTLLAIRTLFDGTITFTDVFRR
ncbi:LuxR family transcriptional regulator [Sphingomonas sp. 1P08PE]|uniref:LuxR family transcriptional regulator n=1 Tax=Sphingomonas sp. 1P08PE TaxID=554122 RepID=UPI0039A150D5